MITLNVESLNLEVVEAAAIRAVLLDCAGNKTQAALILGCDRRSLYRKMERSVLGCCHRSRRLVKL